MKVFASLLAAVAFVLKLALDWHGAAINSLFICSGGVLLGWAFYDEQVKHGKIKPSQRDVNRTQNAINIYLKTGHETKPFLTAGSPIIKAARQRRIEKLLDERITKESSAEYREFHAFCKCPNCNALDLHWLTPTGRECRSCGYNWHQDLRHYVQT